MLLLTIAGRTVYSYHQWYRADVSVLTIVRNSTTNILAKYKDATPSLIVHLHPTHFRFDQQVHGDVGKANFRMVSSPIIVL
jgi:hypothetical protein